MVSWFQGLLAFGGASVDQGLHMKAARDQGPEQEPASLITFNRPPTS